LPCLSIFLCTCKIKKNVRHSAALYNNLQL